MISRLPVRLRRGIAPALVASVAIAAPASFAASGGTSPGGVDAAGDGGGKGGVFPVRAKHTYGDGLGAGRGHQGQDILAKCGKPLVSAVKGRVVHKDYEGSGAGNYIVVRNKKQGDFVYMHMLRKASVRKGERLAAGEKIGRVGSTGRSTACHLHFEMWSSPGWYRGGRTIDPKPHLKRWDRNS